MLTDLSLFLVDKATFMVGSYGPRPEEYEFLTPVEEAPKGMLARGTYHNKSFFTDDDKQDHLTWEWNLAIKKEWTEWGICLSVPPLLPHQKIPSSHVDHVPPLPSLFTAGSIPYHTHTCTHTVSSLMCFILPQLVPSNFLPVGRARVPKFSVSFSIILFSPRLSTEGQKMGKLCH